MRRSGLASGWIAQIEEVDIVVRLRGEPLPADTRLEADRRSVGAPLDRRVGRLRRTRRSSASPPVPTLGGRLPYGPTSAPLGVVHDLVDRKLELTEDREERVDRRFVLARLDLRD